MRDTTILDTLSTAWRAELADLDRRGLSASIEAIIKRGCLKAVVAQINNERNATHVKAAP